MILKISILGKSEFKIFYKNLRYRYYLCVKYPAYWFTRLDLAEIQTNTFTMKFFKIS